MSGPVAGYAPLWVKSAYSFLDGASQPDTLVEQAHALGLAAVALTDRDGVYGAVRAHVKAKALGVKLVLGAQVTTDAGRVVLLARDREGWGALCQLLTVGRGRSPKGESLVTPDEVCARPRGLVALCPDAALLPRLRDAFGDALYALAARHLRGDERPRERVLREAALRAQSPVVAASEVLYHHRDRKPLHDVLRCIRHGCTLVEAGRRITANAEHALLSPEEMYARFADDPLAVARTREVAARCEFTLDAIRYRYPAERVPDGATPQGWLRALTYEGAHHRHPAGLTVTVRDQIEKELTLIDELDYGGYFLTMREIVDFCRAQGIVCQGRGSAANSVVCYYLGITAIDPTAMGLLFERFLSRERAEPPDIDLDIEHDRREEVIQHVYQKYGRDRAAMVANVIRYRARSALRDVGKVLGIPQTELDGVARQAGHYDASLDEATLTAAGVDPSARAYRMLLALTRQLADMPRHLSIHPGGFLLGHEAVTSLVPVEPATMPGRTVIQWDKYDVEDLGLFKVDLLGLGALTAVHRCFDLLREHEGLDLEMATVPRDDPATYAMIAQADTVGTFQIESRAQMSMLPRLKPAAFYDLVIQVAIVRPGPIQGGMVHPYLRRREGKEPVEYPHPDVEKVLAKTLGVPIFQEQVMRLAMVAADYTAGEADQLRKDMGAWRSSGRIEQHRDRMIPRMVAKGIARDFAERVFQQVLGFGEYGFPESHAASFALIAYITAWLKRHHPAAYVCALLDAQPMGFYAPSTLLEDARRHGVAALPIDVNHSGWTCSLERSPDGSLAVRMGVRYVSGLRRFDPSPPYRSVEHFARTARLPKRALVLLAEAGAFGSLVGDRREALWAVHGVAARLGLPLDADGDEAPVALAPLTPEAAVTWDYRSASHSPRGHPMERHRDALTREGLPDAAGVAALPNGARVRYVGMVICRQRPGTASGVTFFTLEDEAGFVNLVVWRRVFEQYAFVGRTAALLEATGTLQRADGVAHIVVDTLAIPTFLAHSEGHARSRDFH